MLAESIDPKLVALLAERFGRSSEITRIEGGFSNTSVLLDGEDGRFVAKAASREPKRADIRQEATMLYELGPADDIPIVRVVGLIDTEQWTILCTHYILAESGLELIERGAPDLAERAATLGRVVRRVHERGFVHGDVGLHNTLWRGMRLAALVDWEWAAITSSPDGRLADLAWFWWTTAFRQLEPSVLERFVDAYIAVGGPNAVLELGWTEARVMSAVRAKIEMIRSRCPDGSPLIAVWHERMAALAELTVPDLTGPEHVESGTARS